MIFGRRGLAAIQKIQEAQRWFWLHLLKPAWKAMAKEFSAPEPRRRCFWTWSAVLHIRRLCAGP